MVRRLCGWRFEPSVLLSFLDAPPQPPRDPAPRKASSPPPRGAGSLLMALLLASLAMGLASLLVAYTVLRTSADVWPPPGTPRLPAWLWLSTALLACSGVTLHLGVRSVRLARPQRALQYLVATLALGLAFVVSQVCNWWLAVVAHLPPGRNMFAVLFYLFTGVHALHVVGGFVPLAIVIVRARHGAYTPLRHAGLRYCAWYWHFVDAVWLVMFTVLWFGQ